MASREEQELVQKIQILVLRRFAGSYKRAFDHYAQKRRVSGLMDRNELLVLLADAAIGNGMTRGVWADGIMSRFDKNRDGFIAYVELQAVFLQRP